MPEWQLDLRYPIKCPDNIFNGVFSEHVLEHFYIDEANALLKEIYRILKPNGILRLSVPSLEIHVANYLNDKQDNTRKSLASEHIRKLTQEYLHLSVWDYERLAFVLNEIGFVDITRRSFMHSRDNLLCFDLQERSSSSLYVEARKPT